MLLRFHTKLSKVFIGCTTFIYFSQKLMANSTMDQRLTLKDDFANTSQALLPRPHTGGRFGSCTMKHTKPCRKLEFANTR